MTPILQRLTVLLCAGLIASCAVVEPLATPESFTLCTVADVGTTVYAVHTNLAREVNPLLSGSVNAHNFVPLVLSKLVVIGLIWWIYDYLEGGTAAKVAAGSTAAITCGVAAQNALIILKGVRP